MYIGNPKHFSNCTLIPSHFWGTGLQLCGKPTAITCIFQEGILGTLVVVLCIIGVAVALMTSPVMGPIVLDTVQTPSEKPDPVLKSPI